MIHYENQTRPPRWARTLSRSMYLFSLLIACMLWTTGAQAQLAIKYQLTKSLGSYSSISGTGTEITAIETDDNGINITGLPAFTVNGVSYTNARMGSNGWIILYNTTAPTHTTNYSPLSTASGGGTSTVVIAPFGRDLNRNNFSGTAWRQQIGNELIFEWKDYNRYSTSSERLNFQVRLNTATGSITFVYGTIIPGSNSTYPQIGWKTTGTTASNWATDINNLMLDVSGSPNSCNWMNAVTGNANSSTVYINSANSGVVPASGLTFTWTPQSAPEPVRTFSAVSGITSNSATLTWTAPTGATQYNVSYRTVGSCSWTSWSGNPAISATATLTGLASGTYYQYMVQASNGSNNSIYSHIPNAAGSGSGYAATGSFQTLVSCQAPTSPIGSATSTTTANISWTAPGSPPSNGYQYAVTTSATPPGSGTPFAGTSTSVSGLTANTTYYLHVRSNCGGSGYSSWATSASFTTPCTDNSTFPYLQDFNGVTFAPSCWQNNQVSGSGLWQRSTSGSSPTVSPIGAAMAYFNSYSYSSGTQANLVSAPMNFPNNNYQVRFKMYRDNGYTSTADRVLVYYNTAPNLTGATLLGTINRSYTLTPSETVANQWYEYTFNMPSGSAGSGRYVIFSAISAYGNNIFLDEVYIEAQPICLSPTAPTGSATTATTANISWTAPGSPPSNGYQYAVTTSATPPGSGTPFAGTSTSVSGLTANTTYYLHVRSNCGGSGYSTWVTSAPFTTPCAEISTFPYLQDFNGVTFAPSCWQNNQVSGSGLWQRSTSGVNPSVTPIGAGMAYFNSYSYSSGTQANLVSQPISFPSNYYQVRFKMFRDNGYTSNTDRVLVYYNTAPTLSGATLLGTINRSYSLSPVEAVANQWYEYTFNMPSGSAGSGRYIIFSAISGFGNNIYLEDVYVEEQPPCSGTPSGGTATASANPACPGVNFNLSLTGASTGEAGLTYQWQSADDAAFTVNLNTVGTNETQTTSQTTDKYYRCIVTCTNSGQSATSVSVHVTTNPFYMCYCTPGVTSCSSSDVITEITLLTLNNSSGCSANGYGDYRTGMNVPLLAAGSSIPMSVTVGAGGIEYVSVWIDYDHSGTFDASEYTYLGSGNGTTINGTLNIPGSPPQTGVTAMRVRVSYSTQLTGSEACIAYTYGETEDYLVNIGSAYCLSNPISPSNGGSGCPSNGTVNLVWNTFAGATGYDVYFDGNNPPTTLVSANQSDTSYAATVASGVYYWMVVPQVPGGGSSCSVWSFTVSPAPTAVASSGGDVCDGFDISLYGDNTAPGQGSGNSYSWSGPNGFNSTIQNPTITGPNSSYTGYYTVVVTNQYGCTDVDSVQVTVNPNPTLNIINTQNVGCMGGSDGTATIGATGGTPDYDFTPDFVNYYQGTAQATVPDLSEGTTTIYVSDVNGCSSTIDVTLTYDYAAPPSQPDPITGAPISVCPNPTDGPYTLSTSATDAASYHWYPGLNITGVNFLTADGSSSIDVEFGTTLNSTYVIRVEATNACGTSPYRAVMIRRTVSTPASITGNTIACANTNNVAYSCAAVTGADSYEWTITGDATVTGTTENATVNFGPAWTGGTLCVAAKVGCFTSSTKCMTISSSVSAAVIGPITGTFTACPNAVQTYSVANISGATYNWTTPSNSNITQGAGTNSVEVTFQNNYNNVGNICVTVVSSCGVSTGPKCKTIAPTVPKRPVSITGPSSGLCNGNVNYSVPPQAGMNFNWTTPGTIIGPNNTETINVQYGAFTTGQVCVSAYNACGTSPSRCMIVKGAPIAAASITPGLACANQNVTFTADTTNIQGDFALTWMYPNTATYVSGGGNTNDVTVTWGSAAGNVILLSSNACGSASKVQAVALDNCRLGEENSQSSAFSVYPNPADNYITIEWNASEQGTTHIVLTDITGKLVKENNIHNTTGINAVTMDVSMLPKGVYMLSAINNKGTINKRVVIE